MLSGNMRQALRDQYDPGDAWGTVMGMWFDIADILVWEGLPIPPEWQYRGPKTWPRQPDSLLVDWWLGGYIDYYDLLDAGNLLHRASRILRAEGRDY